MKPQLLEGKQLELQFAKPRKAGGRFTYRRLFVAIFWLDETWTAFVCNDGFPPGDERELGDSVPEFVARAVFSGDAFDGVAYSRSF